MKTRIVAAVSAVLLVACATTHSRGGPQLRICHADVEGSEMCNMLRWSCEVGGGKAIAITGAEGIPPEDGVRAGDVACMSGVDAPEGDRQANR